MSALVSRGGRQTVESDGFAIFAHSIMSGRVVNEVDCERKARADSGKQPNFSGSIRQDRVLVAFPPLDERDQVLPECINLI